MLSATAIAWMRAADSRGAPALLLIGRDRRSVTPVSLRQGTMWSIGYAPTFPKGMVGAILPSSTAGQPCYLGNVGLCSLRVLSLMTQSRD